MQNVFISYRRSDSIATAGRIRDRLVQHFGRDRIFVDVDDIPHGRDFEKILADKVSNCRVLLAIIGPTWASTRDDTGQRRIAADGDIVAGEIAAALEREDIAVIPVLVDGARMPTAADLPDRLKPLARRNGIELRNTQFSSDADRLIGAVTAALGPQRRSPWRGPAIAASVAGAALLAGYMAWPLFKPAPQSSTPGVAGAPAVAERPATATASVDRGAEIAGAIAKIRSSLGGADGMVVPVIKGGNRVKLGDEIVFEVASKVAGRLILIDINAANEVTQIFPNRYVADPAMATIGPGAALTVPGAGYGFSGFKAVEPAGKGRLLALVVPGSAAKSLPDVERQSAKGFEPVQSPGSYLAQLARQIATAKAAKGMADGSIWAFSVVDYEIVR
jgi:hypothetical protein